MVRIINFFINDIEEILARSKFGTCYIKPLKDYKGIYGYSIVAKGIEIIAYSPDDIIITWSDREGKMAWVETI